MSFKKHQKNLTDPKLWNSIFVFLITPLVEPVLLCPAGQALFGGIHLLMAFYLSLHIKQRWYIQKWPSCTLIIRLPWHSRVNVLDRVKFPCWGLRWYVWRSCCWPIRIALLLPCRKKHILVDHLLIIIILLTHGQHIFFICLKFLISNIHPSPVYLPSAAGVDENSVSAMVMPVSVPAPVSVNGLSVRAAEAVAVLAGMGSGQWSNTAGDASSQSQPTSRWWACRSANGN